MTQNLTVDKVMKGFDDRDDSITGQRVTLHPTRATYLTVPSKL